MGRTYQRYTVGSKTYTGQAQDTFQLNTTNRYAALILQLEGQADTAAGTAAPHAAQVMNIIDELEISDNKSNSYMKLSGAALDYLFRWKQGVTGDNAALAAGAATNAAFRHVIEVPFELLDGFEPQDTHLETVTKDLTVKIKYQSPVGLGVMFGTPSTMALDSLVINVSAKQYDMAVNEPSPPARSLRENIVNFSATADQFRYELDKGTEYRGVTVVFEELVSGVWTPSNSATNLQKELALKGTQNKRTYQSELVRNLRSETLQRRELQTLPAGIVDVPFIANGRAGQNLVSDQTNQLFLEIPVVKTANECRLRIITDALVSQVPGTR
jgi:hypothetical protein